MPLVLGQRFFGELWTAVETHFGEVDDERRIVHHVHLDDQQVIVGILHLRHPKPVDRIRDAKSSQQVIGGTLIVVATLSPIDFDGGIQIGCPNGAVGPVPEESIELYAAADYVKILADAGFQFGRWFMGTHHKDGYSAEVQGFFVVGQDHLRLAKTNGCAFALAESRQLLAGTEGDLLVIVDGVKSSRRVAVVEDVPLGQSTVKYAVTAPF